MPAPRRRKAFGGYRRYAISILLPLIFMLPQFVSHGSSLRKNSPFIPADFNRGKREPRPLVDPEKENDASRELEFQGVYSLRGEYFFNILDKTTRKASWIAEDDPSAPYWIEGYDEEDDKITLNLNGERLDIFLKKRSGKPIPVQTQTASNTAASGVKKSAASSNKINKRRSRVRRRPILPNRNKPPAKAESSQTAVPPTVSPYQNVKSGRELFEALKARGIQTGQ